MSRVPLAEAMRPTTLDEVIGHARLTSDHSLLRTMVEQKQPTNLIFWGPPGVGKTTLARIISRECEAECIELSAVTANKKDVTTAIEYARQNWNLGTRTILFVDEIHRFSKSQQDAFLPHVESGLITLIGATTENPSFEVIAPLLSRSRVVVLSALAKDDIIDILHNALKKHPKKPHVDTDALDYIAELSSGDARAALGHLELVASLHKSPITLDTVKHAIQTQLPRYDKTGDMHYDIVSAFIKSMRGSDTKATLYYLARMLQAGEDPSFIARRMVIFASEDIGLAGNGALSLAVATFDAVKRIGMPEAQYVLYHCATAFARSPKSRETTDLMHDAQALAKHYPNAAVPLHIRNAPTSLMKNLGYGKDYEWKAGFQHKGGFLPEEIN